MCSSIHYKYLTQPLLKGTFLVYSKHLCTQLGGGPFSFQHHCRIREGFQNHIHRIRHIFGCNHKKKHTLCSNHNLQSGPEKEIKSNPVFLDHINCISTKLLWACETGEHCSVLSVCVNYETRQQNLVHRPPPPFASSIVV